MKKFFQKKHHHLVVSITMIVLMLPVFQRSTYALTPAANATPAPDAAPAAGTTPATDAVPAAGTTPATDAVPAAGTTPAPDAAPATGATPAPDAVPTTGTTMALTLTDIGDGKRIKSASNARILNNTKWNKDGVITISGTWISDTVDMVISLRSTDNGRVIARSSSFISGGSTSLTVPSTDTYKLWMSMGGSGEITDGKWELKY